MKIYEYERRRFTQMEAFSKFFSSLSNPAARRLRVRKTFLNDSFLSDGKAHVR